MSTLEDHDAEQAVITAQYENEIVTRCAPRWAWDTIDESLALDARSSASDPGTRETVGAALGAMITASEEPDIETLARPAPEAQAYTFNLCYPDWYANIVTVEAASIEEACEKALEQVDNDAWKSTEAGATFIDRIALGEQRCAFDGKALDVPHAFSEVGVLHGLPEDVSKALALVREIAAFTKDGEKLGDDGEPWEMPNDDAWGTIHSVISQARALLGIDDPLPSEPATEEAE